VVAVASQQLLFTQNDGAEEKSAVVPELEKAVKLKIDTAKLTLQKRLLDPLAKAEDVQISFLSDICYQCNYYVADRSDRHQSNTTVLVDTRWPLSIKFQTSNCNETVYHHFGEYGEYEVQLDFNLTSCNISGPVQLKTPINSMAPIGVAFAIFVGIGVLYLAVEWFLRRKNAAKAVVEESVLVEGDETNAGHSDNVIQDGADEQQQQQQQKEEPVTSFAKLGPVKKARERLKSIDTFRGLCLVVMIFVNFRGGYYWFFRHSAWNGLTVADLVFAWFMFLMGVNIPLSLESLQRRETPKREIAYKVVRRTLILFSLGLFIINHNTSWSTMRIPGVLQRFAVAYFVAFMLQWIFHIREEDMEFKFVVNQRLTWLRPFRDMASYWGQWICTFLLEATWLFITFLMPVPGCPTGYIGPGGLADHGKYGKSCVGGAAGYIDRKIFGENHMYGHPTCKNVYYPLLTNDEKVPFDPEGILGSINGCIMVIIGCQAGKIFLYYKTPRARITRWLSWSLGLGVISIVLCKASANEGWIPVNKNLWSTTYVTTLACMGFFLLALFYFVIDYLKVWTGRPLDIVGMNSILLYVGHEVFTSYVPFSWGIGQHNSHAEWLAMNLIGVTYWVVISFYCFYIKFFLKI